MVKKRVTKASKRRLVVFGTLSCLMIGYFLISVVNYAYSISKLEHEKALLEEKLLSLKEDEQNLKIEIQKLQDPEYIARYARENYLYSKDGEYIIKIEKEKTVKEEEVPKEDAYYQYLMGIIGIIIFLMIFYVFKKARKEK